MNNDQKYIKLLHEYNYLKDAAFELVGIVANLARVPTKDIFEEFVVKDVEKEDVTIPPPVEQKKKK